MNVPPSRMPPAWFHGEAAARGIGEIIRRRRPGDDIRPLAAGERMLGSFILPPFHRPAVWAREQQVKLIESLWSGLPVGACVFNFGAFHGETDMWLLDGQQRITALLSYAAGDFPVLGHLYTDLDRSEQLHFEHRPFACIQTNILSAAQCRIVYDRLAYGGTAHDAPAASTG